MSNAETSTGSERSILADWGRRDSSEKSKDGRATGSSKQVRQQTKVSGFSSGGKGMVLSNESGSPQWLCSKFNIGSDSSVVGGSTSSSGLQSKQLETGVRRVNSVSASDTSIDDDCSSDESDSGYFTPPPSPTTSEDELQEVIPKGQGEEEDEGPEVWPRPESNDIVYDDQIKNNIIDKNAEALRTSSITKTR